MSRSGYSDDCEQWSLICWRGAVASAIRGARGQAFLKEMLAALDAMPEKRLIAHELAQPRMEDPEAGTTVLEVCAIGAVGAKRGLDMTEMDPEDREGVARAFGIAPALAAEIVFENDEAGSYYQDENPEVRYSRMRAWVQSHIIPEQPTV